MFDWLVLLAFYFPFQIALNPGVFLRFFGINFRTDFDFSSLRLFIVLLFVVWILTGSIFKDRAPFKNFPGICLIIFLFISLFSLIGAENIGLGARKIIYFISVFPLYFLTVGFINKRKKIKRVSLILILGAAVSSLIGVVQFLFQFVFGLESVYRFWAVNILPVFSGFNLGVLVLSYPSWLVNIGGKTILRAFSFFSDPHAFSFYLGLTLPLMPLFLFKAPKNSKNFIIFLSFYLTIFFGLLLSFARGAYLAVGASFLVISFLSWKYLNSRKIPVLLLTSLLIFIIPATPFSSRFYSAFDLSEGSNLGRLGMWKNAGWIGLENLWQGVGLGNYFLTVDSALDYRNPITAHNFYLDLFSEMGIFAPLLWLILIGGTIFFLFRRLNKFWLKQREKYFLVALIGSLVYFSVHSFFETAIYNPSVLAALMVILGLSANLLKKEKDAQKDN